MKKPATNSIMMPHFNVTTHLHNKYSELTQIQQHLIQHNSVRLAAIKIFIVHYNAKSMWFITRSLDTTPVWEKRDYHSVEWKRSKPTVYLVNVIEFEYVHGLCPIGSSQFTNLTVALLIILFRKMCQIKRLKKNSTRGLRNDISSAGK